jgi:hypothetical protein
MLVVNMEHIIRDVAYQSGDTVTALQKNKGLQQFGNALQNTYYLFKHNIL